MLILKRHPSSILAKSQSRLHEIITNGVVLKSTRRALLKNVQDGNSKCFGGREINKTKVGTILWDTLYLILLLTTPFFVAQLNLLIFYEIEIKSNLA